MTISFSCDKCSRTLKVPKRFAGKRAKCPKCGHGILIPQSTPELDDKFAATDAQPISNSSGGGVEESRVCKHCGEALGAQAIICVACGTNATTGQRSETVFNESASLNEDSTKLLSLTLKFIVLSPVFLSFAAWLHHFNVLFRMKYPEHYYFGFPSNKALLLLGGLIFALAAIGSVAIIAVGVLKAKKMSIRITVGCLIATLVTASVFDFALGSVRIPGVPLGIMLISLLALFPSLMLYKHAMSKCVPLVADDISGRVFASLALAIVVAILTGLALWNRSVAEGAQSPFWVKGIFVTTIILQFVNCIMCGRMGKSGLDMFSDRSFDISQLKK